MPMPIVRPYVEFMGERYFLENNGYYRTSRSRGRRLYHRDVWAAANGPIPDRWEVHHIDLDQSNNDITNLVALSKSDHVLSHGPRGAFAESSAVRSAKRRAEWAARQPRTVVCRACGTEYLTTGQRAMFCSSACGRPYYG